MFLAGQASAERRVDAAVNRPAHGPHSRSWWLWPASTAALAATSLALAAALVLRPVPQPLVVMRDRPTPVQPGPAQAAPRIESVVTTAATMPAAASSAPLPSDNYIRTREVALRMGLDALGSPATSSNRLASPMYRELLEATTAEDGQRAATSSRPDFLFNM
jgi:hypothetical protein